MLLHFKILSNHHMYSMSCPLVCRVGCTGPSINFHLIFNTTNQLEIIKNYCCISFFLGNKLLYSLTAAHLLMCMFHILIRLILTVENKQTKQNNNSIIIKKKIIKVYFDIFVMFPFCNINTRRDKVQTPTETPVLKTFVYIQTFLRFM